MALHPQAVAFLEYAATELPQLVTQSPAEARATVDSGEGIGPGPAVAGVRDLRIAVSGAEIPARLYEPDDPTAVIVWMHGGGWVICGLETHDAMCRMLANAASATVLSFEYRRSPEFPFPTPLEDCWDALNWAAGEWPSLPLVVGGDSAGGNMAAVCAIRARDRGGPQLAAQILVYPVTDHDMTTGSYREHGDAGLMLGEKEMVWFLDHYLPAGVDRDNPEISPLRTPELAGLPPAIVVVAEYDPLRDEVLAYAERLREAGVETTLHLYEDMPHAFFSFVTVLDRGDEAVERVGGNVRSLATGRVEG